MGLFKSNETFYRVLSCGGRGNDKRGWIHAVALAGAIALLSIGCTLAVRETTPPAPVAETLPMDARSPRSWAELPPLPGDLPPQARLLSGLAVVLDPGHGGDVGEQYDREGYKRGPTGLREAVVNMRTALALRDLLEASGATVHLTREDDVIVLTEDRVRMANEWGADLFLSIHHNAGSPTANYSSVWYHRDGADHPASLDVARELADSLVWTIRPPQPMSSGVYSDLLMYGQGFGVLRGLEMPGVLAECSFFSNPVEEERLRDPAYNERVAWALYLGLVRWAANGLPTWQVDAFTPDGVTLRLADGMKEPWGSDGLRLRPGSLRVLVDGVETAAWSLDGNLLAIADERISELDPSVVVSVQFDNRAKNASITPPRSVGWMLDVLAAREPTEPPAAPPGPGTPSN